MTDNVRYLRCKTTLDLPVDRVLEGAATGKLESAVVVGKDADGDLYVASSLGSEGDTLLLLEKAKQFLLAIS